MPRKPRIHYAGAIYHAMARGVEGRDIFIDDHDRRRFLNQMRRYAREFGADILAYCLMGNHFHLVIRVAASPLASYMQRLDGGYASAFNHRYDRVGHLFQSRYKEKLCLDDRYLTALIHYVHMNPVRAGLVSSPQDWPWSSFKVTDAPFPDLTEFEPWDRDDQPTDLKNAELEVKQLDEIGASGFLESGVTIDRLRSRKTRDRETVSARRKFVTKAIFKGHSLAAAARWLGTSRSTVGRYTEEANQ